MELPRPFPGSSFRHMNWNRIELRPRPGGVWEYMNLGKGDILYKIIGCFKIFILLIRETYDNIRCNKGSSFADRKSPTASVTCSAV